MPTPTNYRQVQERKKEERKATKRNRREKEQEKTKLLIQQNQELHTQCSKLQAKVTQLRDQLAHTKGKRNEKQNPPGSS